jgi:hypothetical protein
MEMRFKPVKEGKQEVNQRVCTTLEDAADYCQLLRRDGYTVIAYDEEGNQYQLSEDGRLERLP